ncbi:MAG: hypothetical protein AABW89_02820 [Nanoarchaeota archaeon]
MRNYFKGTFVLFALSFFILSAYTVDAYSYNSYTYTDRDSFSYRENINGGNDGFRIDFTDTDTKYRGRGYTYCKSQGYYDWSYNGRRCKNSYGYYGDMPYYKDNSYDNIDQDAVLKEAFRTYQQNSKYEYQLELKRIALEERRRYNYGGYGYGYSGARYYSYGW